MHRLDRKRSGAVDGPVEQKLAVASGIRARPAGGVRDRYIGLGVDGIGGILAPLGGCGECDLQRRGRTQRQRWLDVDEVDESRVTRKRHVIAVRE